MTDNTSVSNKSLHSINSLNTLKGKDKSTIPFRIDFIKELLKNKKLQPMINFEDTATENFIHSKKKDIDSDDKISYDTQIILNKKVYDFNQLISQIGGKLLYIKSGTTGHAFKGIITDESGEVYNYGVKVVAYQLGEKYGNIHDVRRPENAELMIIKLLSYFVVKKQTPHIILPIGTFDTNIETFVSLIKDDYVDKDNKKYQEFVDKYKKGEYHKYVSVLICEWANRGDLLDFIRKNYKKFKPMHWKVLFFQIISVLAVIQSKFPNFRHNDLKANNILVHKINRKPAKFSYTVVKCVYEVPNIGYQIKLWDFDFASIGGTVENAKVNAKWTKAINVSSNKNRYYDIHYFFNTLIKKGFFPQFMTEDIIPKDAKEFVNRVVPKKYQSGENIHKRGRILTDEEYLTPDEILKTDKYFEEFRVNKKRPQKDKPILHKCNNEDESAVKILEKELECNENDDRIKEKMHKLSGKEVLDKNLGLDDIMLWN